MYFLVKVSYESMTPSGSMKKVRESYVIDAVSFTEAEARTIGELQPKIDRELVVDAMSKVSFSRIIRTGKERWYKAKLNYITIDERSGKEKRKSTFMLVEADSVEEANKIIVGFMGMAISQEYEIDTIGDYKIEEVFDYTHETGQEEDIVKLLNS